MKIIKIAIYWICANYFVLKIVCSLSGPTLTIEIGTSSNSSNLARYFFAFSGSFSYSVIPVISCKIRRIA